MSFAPSQRYSIGTAFLFNLDADKKCWCSTWSLFLITKPFIESTAMYFCLFLPWPGWYNCRRLISTRFSAFPYQLTINWKHYCDVIMGLVASQITSLTIVYSTIYSDADQRKHQSSASLAFVRGIHWGPVNYPHKWPVTWKMFPFDDVIMKSIEFIWD